MLAAVKALWPAIERGLQWMDGPGDRDGDGFLEYARADEKGLQNQGWKDSFDAVFHADGTLAEGPIALVEVQGYSYAARRAAAKCAAALGFADRAAALDRVADDLARKFDEAFWCEDIGMYALALDGKKQPCRVRTSNAAHVLWTGIARPERAKRIGHEVTKPNFMSGWGVRTVAVGESRYNPMSYHNGSIWPHDNSLIVLGLARYGLLDQAERVFDALFSAASYFDLRRLPELFCGFRRRQGAAPTLYPVACAPQAWAAATPFLLLQAVLGLEFDPVCQEHPVPQSEAAEIRRGDHVAEPRLRWRARGRDAAPGRAARGLARAGQQGCRPGVDAAGLRRRCGPSAASMAWRLLASP